MNNVEHLLMCLLAINISSLVKCLFNFLPIFKLRCLLSYYYCVTTLLNHSDKVLNQTHDLQIFFQCALPINFLTEGFFKAYDFFILINLSLSLSPLWNKLLMSCL